MPSPPSHVGNEEAQGTSQFSLPSIFPPFVTVCIGFAPGSHNLGAETSVLGSIFSSAWSARVVKARPPSLAGTPCDEAPCPMDDNVRPPRFNLDRDPRLFDAKTHEYTHVRGSDGRCPQESGDI